MANTQRSSGFNVADRYLNVESNGAAPSQFYGAMVGSTPPSTPCTPHRYNTGSMAPSQLGYDSNFLQGQETTQMLQTISTTLNDIQFKLFTIQNQYTQQDAQLKKLQQSINNLEKAGSQDKSARQTKPRKSPRGLSACVRSIHATLPAEGQYTANEKVSSVHNKLVTQQIVDKVTSKEYSDQVAIAYAAKRYHEYLVRLQRPITEETKLLQTKNSRSIQRRQRLFERRIKCAMGREIKIMQSLNEKFMSDEETDAEDDKSFIKRSPTWRCEKLNTLIHKLDKRHFKKRIPQSHLRSEKLGLYVVDCHRQMLHLGPSAIQP